ncbi:ribosome recycling factor [Patescibacteria group bacterium]|nr:ribosome recycling factor [Patescibacteria group bacterium]
MYKEIIDKIRPELDKVINFLERELTKIRVGRVSISLVEDIEVECFGQKFPLKQLGTISSPESRQLLIQPWDNSYLEPILKALSQSNLGMAPIADKNSVRISLPPLSEEYRKDLLRILSGKMEDARKTIRHWRQVAWDEIQEGFKTGEVREDDKYRGKDELQELVDEYNEKIGELIEKKKKEIVE